MAKRRKKKVIEKIGEVKALDALKASQPWMGNQRSMAHKSTKDYNRKKKHPNKGWENCDSFLRGSLFERSLV